MHSHYYYYKLFFYLIISFYCLLPQQSKAFYAKSKAISIEERTLPIERKKTKKKKKKAQQRKRILRKRPHKNKETNNVERFLFISLISSTIGVVFGTTFLIIGGIMSLWNPFLLIGLIAISIVFIFTLFIIGFFNTFSHKTEWAITLLINLFAILIAGILLFIIGLVIANPLLWIVGIVLCAPYLFVLIWSLIKSA